MGPSVGQSNNKQVDMKPKDKLKAIAQTRVFWIVVASALTAAGINVPPAVLEALPVIGPLLAF